MAKHHIALIPGDGIGPEVAAATERIVAASGVDIEWSRLEAGGEFMAKYGTPMPDQALNEIRRLGVALKGPIATPVASGFASANVTLRKALDLYAAVRPVKTLRGVESRYTDVRLTVIRENTEDLYSGIEHLIQPGIAESIKIVTDKACLRICRFGMEHARRSGFSKVAIVHKANIMKITDGLFLECARRVARDFPDIEYSEVIVDNMCMQLVKDPTRYEVLIMENLYGDIVSDLCSGLVGGLGVVPGANIGESAAVFEAVHGSAPDIAGKNKANPTALTMSAVMMLRHINEDTAADRIQNALEAVLAEGKTITADLGGSAGTTEFAAAVIEKLNAQGL
ncbi:MAG TPA: isocitrate/isopropylmalate dehydrogenase family protein [Abditibacteriaceae bacterium]|jgi:isocitrate dehydrogenase (NAD+)